MAAEIDHDIASKGSIGLRRGIVPAFRLAAVTIALAISASISTAQTVAIQNGIGERGFGWMFRHNGLCYVVLPRHVAGPFPRVTVTSEAPIVTGTGVVDLPFWDGMDLAIAIVRGGIEERCREDLGNLSATDPLSSPDRLELVRLTAGGDRVVDRLSLTSSSYLTFDARLSDGGSSIGQGTSGAFAMVQGRPVGMSVSAVSDDAATFIRADEIYIHLNRYLSQNFGAAAAAADPSGGRTGAAASEIPLAIASVRLPPVNPIFAPENLLSDGNYVYDPTATNQLILTVGDDGAEALTRLVLEADTTSGYSIPREILVEVSPAADGRFLARQSLIMGQDGTADTGRMPSRTVRRIRITVLSAWAPGPVILSRLRAE